MIKVGNGATDTRLVKRLLHRTVYKLIGHLIPYGFPIVDLTFAEKNGSCHGMNRRVTPRKREREKHQCMFTGPEWFLPSLIKDPTSAIHVVEKGLVGRSLEKGQIGDL